LINVNWLTIARHRFLLVSESPTQPSKIIPRKHSRGFYHFLRLLSGDRLTVDGLIADLQDLTSEVHLFGDDAEVG